MTTDNRSDGREMTMTDDAEWDRFVDHVRKDAALEDRGLVRVHQPVPQGEVDIKFAVELGLGDPVRQADHRHRHRRSPGPGHGLGEIADAAGQIADMDTEAGQVDLQEKSLPVLRQLN